MVSSTDEFYEKNYIGDFDGISVRAQFSKAGTKQFEDCCSGYDDMRFPIRCSSAIQCPPLCQGATEKRIAVPIPAVRLQNRMGRQSGTPARDHHRSSPGKARKTQGSFFLNSQAIPTPRHGPQPIAHARPGNFCWRPPCQERSRTAFAAEYSTCPFGRSIGSLRRKVDEHVQRLILVHFFQNKGTANLRVKNFPGILTAFSTGPGFAQLCRRRGQSHELGPKAVAAWSATCFISSGFETSACTINTSARRSTRRDTYIQGAANFSILIYIFWPFFSGRCLPP